MWPALLYYIATQLTPLKEAASIAEQRCAAFYGIGPRSIEGGHYVIIKGEVNTFIGIAAPNVDSTATWIATEVPNPTLHSCISVQGPERLELLGQLSEINQLAEPD